MSLNKATFPQRGWVNRKGVVYWATTLVIGAAGAITSQDGQTAGSAAALAISGLLATKQGTAGQYLIQTYPLNQKGRYLVELSVGMIGAPGATSAGQEFGWLTNNITGGTGAGNILLQAYRIDTAAAADVPNGNSLVVTIGVDYGL